MFTACVLVYPKKVEIHVYIVQFVYVRCTGGTISSDPVSTESVIHGPGLHMHLP